MTQEDILNKVNSLIVVYDLKKRSRKIDYTYPRFYLMNYLRQNTNLSLAKIALLFDIKTKKGLGDHSVIIYGVKIHHLLRKDKNYQLATEVLKSELEEVTPSLTILDEKKIIEEVLACTSYWQMRKLQNKLVENATFLE